MVSGYVFHFLAFIVGYYINIASNIVITLGRGAGRVELGIEVTC